MGKIFITGSADGLGHLSANALIQQGHEVILHARNAERGREALGKAPGAQGVVTGDLSNLQETKNLAAKVNELGAFDAVIHNAGVYKTSGKEIFTVNTLAPYILTCLMHRPRRVVYLSSGMHLQGTANLDSFKKNIDQITYSDSKLHVVMLAKAIAELWSGVFSNSVDPGWVPTKMGGKGAPDDLEKGYETQVWLATSNDPQAKVTGKYFHHKTTKRYNSEADNLALREKFIMLCEEITGVSLPN